MGRLGGTTARYQYGAVVAVGFVRPEQMGVGASAPVVPEFTVGFQVVHRRRVGMAFIKGAYPPGDGGSGRRGTVVVVHDRVEPFPATLNPLGTAKRHYLEP